ncbi:uncharacterized protein K444DRAFT_339158 [Hyaloscypha bicolor E]|uniref:Nephrocystin 3-like N-terminal domain-containing protein n=1 Tax=Hyaloscypha bicolor E TaxID=1095630 RepID=A0A2J6TGZ1_9HELO|nr:uncharacterized protein K444DRAFT_339158 [Hyaloscypha bicolor E]PMD62296.1 hypothetical protein K444DRAFT_339158 [Hyaloscypha bicolor E]
MAFFYCSKDTNRVSRTNPDDILRSIVAQLSYSKMGIVRNQWINRKFGSTLSEKDCTQLLATLIDTVGSSTVVIDALDECSDPYSLMEALRMISDELTKCASAHSLKIFISSREEDRVTADFPNAICISITQEETHKDMGSFIQNEISRRRAKINHRTQGESEQMTNDLAEKLRCILEGRAQSM